MFKTVVIQGKNGNRTYARKITILDTELALKKAIEKFSMELQIPIEEIEVLD